jgi:hypothetical protein
MMKKLLFSAALLSITLLGGCAKGGSGPCAVNCPGIDIDPPIQTVGLNVSVPLTLTFVNATASPVTWAIQPSSCGSACGTLTNVTGSTATYVGPSTVPSSPSTFTITATSQTDGGLTGTTEALTIIPVTAQVAPVTPNVQVGLTEQYTAVALPEQAPQTFTWSCMVNGVQCANFSPAANNAGVATYTPTAGEECSSSGCVTISATANVDPTGCTINPKILCTPSQTTVVSSRVPTGQYSFQFSGYDSNGKAIAVAGTFTVDSGGAISGYEDEWAAGTLAKRAFSGGSYNPISGSNPNSNNAGTLSLNTGAFPSSYQVVLDAAGDIQMIAASGGESGSGIAEPAATNKFNKGAGNPATFVFGFTGVDSSNTRVGYAGLLPTDGVSMVTGGLIDANDNGNATNGICNVSAAPCTVTGSYAPDGTVSNLWHLTLTAPVAMTFDFFVANGNESNANNPLYLYAISTDNNPAMLGTMVLQNSKITSYDTDALSGGSVSAVTGTNANVAIVLGDLNGGTFTGNFGENNNGAVVLLPPTNPCPTTAMPKEVCQFGNTYAATGNSTGRYTLPMLGNPNASTPVDPITFIFYASGANRGFLLDPSSTAVFTGTMNAQVAPKQNVGNFAAGSAPGPYAVATYSNSAPSDAACSSSVSLLTACSVTMNLLLTEPSSLVYDVTGTENPSTAFSALYTLASGGAGTFGPLSGATTPNYWMYAVTETSFFLIDVDTNSSGPPVVSPILFMTQ